MFPACVVPCLTGPAPAAARPPGPDPGSYLCQEAFRREQPPIFHVHFGPNKINMHAPALWQGEILLRGEAFTLKGPTALPGCGDFCFVWTASVAELYTALDRANAPIITKADDPLINTDSGAVPREGGRQEGTQMGTSVYCRDPDGNLLEFITYDGGAAARSARSGAVDGGGRDWAGVRARLFPGAARHTAYLNTAVGGMMSADAVAGLASATQDWVNNPTSAVYDVFDGSLLEAALEGLAQLLSCDVGELALTGNTTDGLNIAAQMLKTDCIALEDEFASGPLAWMHAG